MNDNKDRLNELFKGLRRRGLVARQNFSCCGGCASYELGCYLENRPKKRGAVYYHRQDADKLYGRGWSSERGGESVFLGYGCNEHHLEDGQDMDEQSRLIGRDIVECAAEVGLECRWNGSEMQRVEVLLPGGIYGGREQ